MPSFWRDEGATLSAVHRSFPQLIRMLGQLDAVHGMYYVLMWLQVRLAGSGELAMRLPSALAMAATAGLLTALGRRLVSAPAGLAAGLSFAAIPAVSWFGEDARPFALETAFATAATYCLARLLEDLKALVGGGGARRSGSRRRRWRGAAIGGSSDGGPPGLLLRSLIGLGLANIFGLLLIAAHGADPADAARPHRAARSAARRWLAAVTVARRGAAPAGGAGLVAAGPGGLAAHAAGRLAGQHRAAGRHARGGARPSPCSWRPALAVAALGGRSRFQAAWPGGWPRWACPGCAVPPALLIRGSQLQPVYTFRYIVFCRPWPC